MKEARRPLRIAFAGDRDISIWVLEFLLGRGERPVALCLTDPSRASHSAELRRLCSYLPDENVLIGAAFREPAGIARLRQLNLDILLSVHFPYVVPKDVLAMPSIGVLNLHPAHLPFNRGWHTPSWAILDRTPYGATLHFMDEGVDTGDIVHQRRLDVLPSDTANSLYDRARRLEFDVFQEAWPQVVEGTFRRIPQSDQGPVTAHSRKDLFSPAVQRIDLEAEIRAGELIDKLRALTTNRVQEAAYFELDGRRYRIRVDILADDAVGESQPNHPAKTREGNP